MSEWVGRYDVIGEAKTMYGRGGAGNLEMLPARALVSAFLVGPVGVVCLELLVCFVIAVLVMLGRCCDSYWW